jgi:hypothetical protein
MTSSAFRIITALSIFKEKTMNTAEHLLIEKIQQLPPVRQAEVADFVDFLRSRENDHALVQAAAQASVPSFAAVWDNDADAVYDKL